jgi:hypothetical protein
MEIDDSLTLMQRRDSYRNFLDLRFTAKLETAAMNRTCKRVP